MKCAPCRGTVHGSTCNLRPRNRALNCSAPSGVSGTGGGPPEFPKRPTAEEGAHACTVLRELDGNRPGAKSEQQEIGIPSGRTPQTYIQNFSSFKGTQMYHSPGGAPCHVFWTLHHSNVQHQAIHKVRFSGKDV
jgi:hypothetical protein